MAGPATRFRTVEDFLSWERQQPMRWEWHGADTVAMTGGTSAHNIVLGNLRSTLWRRLWPRGCRVYSESMKVILANAMFYPDVVVTCSPVANDEDHAIDPVLIAEVLSPSSATFDRGAKRAFYQSLPSLRHYLILAQSESVVLIDSRDDAGWVTTRVSGLQPVPLPGLGIEVPMAEIYEGTGLVGDTP